MLTKTFFFKFFIYLTAWSHSSWNWMTMKRLSNSTKCFNPGRKLLKYLFIDKNCLSPIGHKLRKADHASNKSNVLNWNTSISIYNTVNVAASLTNKMTLCWLNSNTSLITSSKTWDMYCIWVSFINEKCIEEKNILCKMT